MNSTATKTPLPCINTLTISKNLSYQILEPETLRLLNFEAKWLRRLSLEWVAAPGLFLKIYIKTT